MTSSPRDTSTEEEQPPDPHPTEPGGARDEAPGDAGDDAAAGAPHGPLAAPADPLVGTARPTPPAGDAYAPLPPGGDPYAPLPAESVPGTRTAGPVATRASRSATRWSSLRRSSSR